VSSYIQFQLHVPRGTDAFDAAPSPYARTRTALAYFRLRDSLRRCVPFCDFIAKNRLTYLFNPAESASFIYRARKPDPEVQSDFYVAYLSSKMYSAVFFYPAGCTCREMNTWLKYMTIRRGRIPRFCCCRLAAANAALSLSPYLLHRAFGACHFERERERESCFELVLTMMIQKSPEFSKFVRLLRPVEISVWNAYRRISPSTRGALYFARSLSPAHGLSLCISTPGTKHKTPCGLRVSRGTSSS